MKIRFKSCEQVKDVDEFPRLKGRVGSVCKECSKDAGVKGAM